MVKYSDESPFLQDEGDGAPSAVCSQHVRSLELLKTIIQVGPTNAAGLPTHRLISRDVTADGRSDNPRSTLFRSWGLRVLSSYRWLPPKLSLKTQQGCVSRARSACVNGTLPHKSICKPEATVRLGIKP